MTWEHIFNWLNPFFWGLLIGFGLMPMLTFIRVLRYELKLAIQEWKKPNG